MKLKGQELEIGDKLSYIGRFVNPNVREVTLVGEHLILAVDVYGQEKSFKESELEFYEVKNEI